MQQDSHELTPSPGRCGDAVRTAHFMLLVWSEFGLVASDRCDRVPLDDVDYGSRTERVTGMAKTSLMVASCLALFMSLSLFETWWEGAEFLVSDVLIDFAEAILIFGAVTLTSVTAVRLKGLHEERVDLLHKMETARFEGTQWRQLADGYVKGLGQAISKQFQEWRLTAGEADIAMLILKGFSNREIATLRKTSEATVRQQASTIYSKSGLRNHRELSAYFLEDLTPALTDHSDLLSPDVSFSDGRERQH